jgi:PPM family protein phosphatase
MGSTLTAVCLDGGFYHIAHAGDSRLYLIRDGKATSLTRDHSTAGEMVRMGVLSPDKVRGHDRRSELTQALGLGLFLQPEILRVPAQPGDRLVLCTDGVWGVIEDASFAEVSAEEATPQELGRRLVDMALEQGSDDNVSVLVVEQTDVLPVTQNPESQGVWGWLRRLFLPPSHSVPPGGRA